MEIDDNTCLHCNKNKPSYCESCYQELISENMRLKVELEKYKNKEVIK